MPTRVSPDNFIRAESDLYFSNIANDGFRTRLDVDNHHLGIFASDTYTPLPPLSIQLAARFTF